MFGWGFGCGMLEAEIGDGDEPESGDFSFFVQASIVCAVISAIGILVRDELS